MIPNDPCRVAVEHGKDDIEPIPPGLNDLRIKALNEALSVGVHADEVTVRTIWLEH